MSRNAIDQCIRDSLSAYFRDWTARSRRTSNMVLEAVERPCWRQ